MTDKTKIYLRIGLIAAVALLSLFGLFFYKPIWIKIICAILAGVAIYILVKTYISFKRKKHFIDGRILSIEPPKNRFKIGRTKVVIKGNKVSKKLYSWRPVTMKIGGSYAIYYEEKSNEILQYDSLKNLIAQRPKRSNIPPQYR